MEHNIHEETTYERAEREWDEDELKKLSFGDRVIVPSGEEGMVTELDGEEYCVAGDVQLGWFRAEELILAK